LILLVLGMMSPFVIVAVTFVVAAEKLLPRPEFVARVIGSVAIVAGVLASIPLVGNH
jgi:hypothetical protein